MKWKWIVYFNNIFVIFICCVPLPFLLNINFYIVATIFPRCFLPALQCSCSYINHSKTLHLFEYSFTFNGKCLQQRHLQTTIRNRRYIVSCGDLIFHIFKWNSDGVIFLLKYVPLSTKCQRIDGTDRSIEFDDLFVSLSTFHLLPGFAFCQVELRYTW